MQSEKGVLFNIFSIENATEYLKNKNNYFRLASYRKNYDKHTSGENIGKYISLDFAYLTELATIDMHLRFLIIKMCLDIEHSLKVNLLSELVLDDNEDGYDIVTNFLLQNKWVLEDINRKKNSAYVDGIIEKFFNFNTADILCPVWAFLEIITFGQFIKFYEYYYSTSKKTNKYLGLLNVIKSLRNACAHNNCIIHNLRKQHTKPSHEITQFISEIPNISKNERIAKLSVRPIYEITSLLYIYEDIVSETIKKPRYDELSQLVNVRMLKHEDYFESQQIISTSYKFFQKIVDFLI